jgi:hypothetical protein
LLSLQEDVVERVPFLLLGCELPPTPLFKDAMEKNIIPQVNHSTNLTPFSRELLGFCMACALQNPGAVYQVFAWLLSLCYVISS